MRVLKIFFGFTLVVLGLGFLIGLVWREVLLYSAVAQVRSAARELTSLKPSQEFSQKCLEFGGAPITNQSLTRTQLRFISQKKFVLEIVCQTNEQVRQVMEEETLPMLVAFERGQSGLRADQMGFGVTLTILGRTGVVYRGDSFIQSALSYRDEPTLVFDQGPTTTCEGYGFTCCNDTFQIGQDRQQTQAWDCPKSCYASCLDKPVVLNFHSEPSFFTAERSIEVQTGEIVEFIYTVNDIRGDAATRNLIAQSNLPSLDWQTRFFRLIENLFDRSAQTATLVKIMIDFGDGQSVELSGLQGTTTHTYTCNQLLCVYNAVIQAVTDIGAASSLDQQSSIQVEVSGP